MFNPFKKPKPKVATPTPMWLKLGVVAFLVIVIVVNSKQQGDGPSPIGAMMSDVKKQLPKAEDYTKHIPKQIDLASAVIREGEGNPPLCGQTALASYKAFRGEAEITSGTLEAVVFPSADAHVMLGELADMRVGEMRRYSLSKEASIDYWFAGASDTPVTAFELSLESAAPNTDALFKDEGLGIKLFDEKMGQGDPARCGEEITVSYRAFAGGGEVLPEGRKVFSIGSGEVIAGLEQGAIGLQVGGKRTLILPSKWQSHLYNFPNPDVAFQLQQNNNILILEVTREK